MNEYRTHMHFRRAKRHPGINFLEFSLRQRRSHSSNRFFISGTQKFSLKLCQFQKTMQPSTFVRLALRARTQAWASRYSFNNATNTQISPLIRSAAFSSWLDKIADGAYRRRSKASAVWLSIRDSYIREPYSKGEFLVSHFFIFNSFPIECSMILRSCF